MNEHLISQAPLFASLPRGEIQRLADTLRPANVPPNTILLREGEIGDRFYIICEGQIEIVKALGTADERLAGVRGPGEYIGEMSLLDRDGLRAASARARTAAQLLEMTRDDFDALLNRQPALAYEMVRVLSTRLKQAHNSAIHDLQEKNRQLAQAYEELKAAQVQIVKKEKLEHELFLAHEVQASLIDQDTPPLPGWEFATRWQPARAVSGDFYDFIPIHTTYPASHSVSVWGLVIADVSDKGMPAALFMALARSIVRASAVSAASPVDCIAKANHLICADSTRSMFVTLCYALLDAPTGTLTFVNAGHNPPLLYHAENDQVDWLKRTGMALGVEPDTSFEQRTAQLGRGDFAVFYTDGVTDAINPSLEEFGVKRLQQIAYEHRRAPAEKIVTALDEALTNFIGSRELFDDITFFVVKRQ